MVDRDAGPRENVIEKLEHRLATEPRCSDRLPGVALDRPITDVMTPGPGKIEKIVANTLPRPRNLRSQKFFVLEDRLRRLIR